MEELILYDIPEASSWVKSARIYPMDDRYGHFILVVETTWGEHSKTAICKSVLSAKMVFGRNYYTGGKWVSEYMDIVECKNRGLIK
jgi:hypothetical protein